MKILRIRSYGLIKIAIIREGNRLFFYRLSFIIYIGNLFQEVDRDNSLPKRRFMLGQEDKSVVTGNEIRRITWVTKIGQIWESR